MSMRAFFPWQPLRSAEQDYHDWLQEQSCHGGEWIRCPHGAQVVRCEDLWWCQG